MSTRISYWIRTTDDVWMEVSPVEILQLWSEGYAFPIRIHMEREASK